MACELGVAAPGANAELVETLLGSVTGSSLHMHREYCSEWPDGV